MAYMPVQPCWPGIAGVRVGCRVLASLCVKFACSCVCVGSLQVHQLPSKAQRHAVSGVRLIGQNRSK